MTKELALAIMPAAGWLLWALGGTGYKWARRFVLPILLGVLALLLEVSWFRVVLTVILSIGALCLPYGSKSPIWQRILTGLTFSVCLLPLKLSFLVLIPSAVFGLTYWLSLRFNWFTWKIAEGLTGLSWALTAVFLM